MNEKKNTFRVEVEASTVSPAEEMKRNQAVHLAHLRSKKAMSVQNTAYIASKIAEFEVLETTIISMPDCECKTGTLGIIQQDIEQHRKALEASAFNGVSAMTLDAFERLAALNARVQVAGSNSEEPSKS